MKKEEEELLQVQYCLGKPNDQEEKKVRNKRLIISYEKIGDFSHPKTFGPEKKTLTD